MILLHTSDWHLGMMLRGGVTYGADQRFFIREICRIAEEEKVDGILLAGDVFDKGIASQEGLQIYDRAMTTICKTMGIQVYLIAGNHDGAERLSQCYELLRDSGLHIAGALTEQVYKENAGDTDIYLLPWISTDKVRSVYPEEAEHVNNLEDAYRVVLDRYRDSFTPGHRNILVSHAYIVDAETSVSDRAAEVGRAAMVPASLFDGFDYVALGHLHGPQNVSEKIRYSGTPMAYSFGKEEKQKKSVTIIDTETMSRKIVEVPQLHKRTTLTGTYEELIKADYPEDVRKGYVRLDVTDHYVGIEMMSAFRERYPNLIEVSGKTYDREDAKITMSIEELEQADNNPEVVFERYCRDILADTPGDRLMTLFRNAVSAYEKEVTEE